MHFPYLCWLCWWAEQLLPQYYELVLLCAFVMIQASISTKLAGQPAASRWSPSGWGTCTCSGDFYPWNSLTVRTIWRITLVQAAAYSAVSSVWSVAPAYASQNADESAKARPSPKNSQRWQRRVSAQTHSESKANTSCKQGSDEIHYNLSSPTYRIACINALHEHAHQRDDYEDRSTTTRSSHDEKLLTNCLLSVTTLSQQVQFFQGYSVDLRIWLRVDAGVNARSMWVRTLRWFHSAADLSANLQNA